MKQLDEQYQVISERLQAQRLAMVDSFDSPSIKQRFLVIF